MALTLGMIGAGHMGTLHARNLMADARVHIRHYREQVISPFAPSISHFLNFKLPVERST